MNNLCLERLITVFMCLFRLGNRFRFLFQHSGDPSSSPYGRFLVVVLASVAVLGLFILPARALRAQEESCSLVTEVPVTAMHDN
jgi:hypothetical protein